MPKNEYQRGVENGKSAGFEDGFVHGFIAGQGVSVDSLKDFIQYFAHWPYSSYYDVEYRELAEKLRAIFPRVTDKMVADYYRER